MKTNNLYRAEAIAHRENILYSKLFLVALIIALLASFLPAASVFASSASTANFAGNSDLEDDLEREWKDKVQNVRAESFFYERVRVFPADFKDPAELAQAHELLNKYGASYRAAQTLIFNHSGFDANGQVIHETTANQSIKDVAEHLRIMRVLRQKLDDLEGKYRLLPPGAITTTTP